MSSLKGVLIMRKSIRYSVQTALLAVILLSCVVFIGGCSKRSVEEKGKPRVALIMKSLANEFFKTMEDGARAHQSENSGKYELDVSGIKDEVDVGQQINLVELMTAKGVDAIVIAPADSKALIPVCKRAMDAGIIVVNIDNKFDDAVLAENGRHPSRCGAGKPSRARDCQKNLEGKI